MTNLLQATALARRLLRAVTRQHIIFAFVQPVLGLLLYAELFRRLVEVPGFGTYSYVSFVLPGCVMMTALLTGGTNAIGQLREMNMGVLDRFLVAPTTSWSLIGGRGLATATIASSQSIVLLLVGWIVGARLPGGFFAIVVMMLSAILLAVGVGTIGICLALWIRRDESVVACNNVLSQVLALTSPIFVATAVMPHWLQWVSRANPVTWAVEAVRGAGHASHTGVLLRLTGLMFFAGLAAIVTTRLFDSFRNSR